MKKIVILLTGILLLCSACSNAQSQGSQNIQHFAVASGPGDATTLPVFQSPTSPPARATIQPTTRPRIVPTAKPTPQQPTPTPFPYHICTFTSCQNPWNYHLQAGINGSGVTSVPAGFCSWFWCAANFIGTGGAGGMIVACNDNAMDWSQDYLANRCQNDQGIRGWLAP